MDTVMQTEVPRPTYRNRSEEIKDLAGALAKAQGLMENAEKSAENPAFKRDGKNSTYATLASVWSAIRSPLATNGLAVMQWPRTVEGGVEIETELLHESGQFMRDILWLPCPQMTVHTVGSAITYGRRYALMAICGIAPEDDDGNAAADAHKPGVPGMANGGGDFRPAGRRQSSWGPGGKQGAIDEARASGLLDETRAKGTLPNKTPDNAIKRIEWVKKAIEGFKAAQTKDELTQWWKTEAERLGVIETALPNEYERLLVAFDEAIERTAVRAA